MLNTKYKQMRIIKSGLLVLAVLMLGLTVSCEQEDDLNIIAGLEFVTARLNAKGNEIGVLPTTTPPDGRIVYTIDFGNQALFADPHRPVEFGAMMSMPLLYPRMRNELSVEGARFARRNFGWTGIAKRMIEVFKSSINQQTMESNLFY